MTTRREFLARGAACGLLGATGLPVVRARDAKPVVQLHPAIEPLVQLVERTPRQKCVGMFADQVRKGVPYRELLASLFLAGIRNVNPQPPGFKFHCVFVINAAHQVSLDLPADQRLLPLFWALDNFKASQQKDVQEGDFRLGPVRGRLPSPETAWDEFDRAMTDWDEQRADRAIVALVRSAGAHQIIESLWRYGARDYRNIGHKAIFVANTWQTLQTIGWQHAEASLRSLVLGLLDFGKSERVNKYAFADQTFLANELFVNKLWPAGSDRTPPANWSPQWSQPGSQPGQVDELLALLRRDAPLACCRHVRDGLGQGRFRAQAAWDAVHLLAGELMMRQPGIYGIHTVTSANALHTAFELAARPANRLLMLLQAVGWMVQFREFMSGARNGLNGANIFKVASTRVPGDHHRAIAAVLADVGKNAPAAAAQARGLAERAAETGHSGWLEDFASTARQQLVRKAGDAHDYKYAMAIFADLHRVSPLYRPQMLSTAAYYLKGSSQPDSQVVSRALEALGTR